MARPPDAAVAGSIAAGAGRPSRRVALPRALWRLVRAVLHALHGGWICAVVFPFLDHAGRMRRVGWWARRMLDVLGIGLEAHGAIQFAPVLLVSNHVSWLDILAIDSVRPARFVSKAGVRHWPLLGFMVACGGTLFIERERKRDALRVVHRVAAALRDGATVAVFPEGTTGAGPALLPFHANLLQAAISTATPVQPVALRYADAADSFSAAPLYLDDTSLLQSVWQVACADTLVVHITALAPVETAATTQRRPLAGVARDAIQQVLDAAGPTPTT